MAKVTPELFEVLNDSKVEITLTRLYRAALQQGWSMVLHFLPKLFKLYGKRIDWKTEDERFYDDKYTPILPYQGTFLYMQARALDAKNIPRIRHVVCHQSSMKHYADYVRNPENGYLSTTIYPKKAMEYTIKLK